MDRKGVIRLKMLHLRPKADSVDDWKKVGKLKLISQTTMNDSRYVLFNAETAEDRRLFVRLDWRIYKCFGILLQFLLIN